MPLILLTIFYTQKLHYEYIMYYAHILDIMLHCIDTVGWTSAKVYVKIVML